MRRLSWHGSDWQWCAVVCATFIVLLLINPLGYVGGGWDDWQYLQAARCWAEHGPCLPRTHWEGRWPVFVPIAAIVGLFGESRATVGLWPLMSSVAAIALLVLVGNRLVGRPAGWLAGLLFLVTPAFSIQILAPSVEAIELALILGGVLAIQIWLERRAAPYALLAGLSFGLAFQVRETALIAVALAGMFVIARKPRVVDIAAALTGFLAPLAIELLVYGIATGEPLFRRMLSMAHTQIPSSELIGPVDKGSPILNPAYIANWRHEPGVEIHWLIDGFANLFVNAKAGMSLALTPLLLLVGGRHIAPEDRRVVIRLYLAALLYASVLIYILAVDPKARVMFAPLAATTLAFSLVAIRLIAVGRHLLAITALTTHGLVGLFVLAVHQQTHTLEEPAARWIAERPGLVEMDGNTKRHLALVPAARALPGLGSDRPFLIYNSIMPCRAWLSKAQIPPGAIDVVAQEPVSLISYVNAEMGGALCLFRYRKPLDSEFMRLAIRRSRRDGRFLMDNQIYR